LHLLRVVILYAVALHVVALHAVALHVVILHAVILRSYSSSSCCRTRACPGLAVLRLCTPEPRASLARSHFTVSASLFPRLAFR
jgi:hypothetical protein